MKVAGDGFKWRQINKEEKESFRRIVGQLMWVSSQTRPDMAYDACELSNTYNNAVGEDISKVNKAVTKLKNSEVSLKFCEMGGLDDLRLVAFSDASYRNL